MRIQQIVSYGNAWTTLVERFPQEYDDIQKVVDSLPGTTAAAPPSSGDQPYRYPPTGFLLERNWIRRIRRLGWKELAAEVPGIGVRRIQMRALGYVRGKVSISFTRHRDSLNRWLHTLAPIAIRNGLIELPICVSLTAQAELASFSRSSLAGPLLERFKEELLALAPLSHPHPFLVLGISSDDKSPELIELASEDSGVARQVVINRSIEFPPEYHHAGLGILSYFGTVLREKYATQSATVRIEQEGLRVRLIIESNNGDREVIEKALEEYELVVRGETQPEEFFESKARVLELKNELRIAQVRIESQRDLIAYQGEEIVSLRQLIGRSLTAHANQPISVTVNPAISVTAVGAPQVVEHAPEISEHIQALAERAANDPDLELRLLDLEESFAKLGAKVAPEEIRKSAGMKKLKSWLDDAASTGTALNKFVQNVNDGVELVQKIARRYNAIAEWCGAPRVPSVLLGEET